MGMLWNIVKMGSALRETFRKLNEVFGEMKEEIMDIRYACFRKVRRHLHLLGTGGVQGQYSHGSSNDWAFTIAKYVAWDRHHAVWTKASCPRLGCFGNYLTLPFYSPQFGWFKDDDTEKLFKKYHEEVSGVVGPQYEDFPGWLKEMAAHLKQEKNDHDKEEQNTKQCMMLVLRWELLCLMLFLYLVSIGLKAWSFREHCEGSGFLLSWLASFVPPLWTYNQWSIEGIPIPFGDLWLILLCYPFVRFVLFPLVGREGCAAPTPNNKSGDCLCKPVTKMHWMASCDLSLKWRSMIGERIVTLVCLLYIVPALTLLFLDNGWHFKSDSIPMPWDLHYSEERSKWWPPVSSDKCCYMETDAKPIAGCCWDSSHGSYDYGPSWLSELITGC